MFLTSAWFVRAQKNWTQKPLGARRSRNSESMVVNGSEWMLMVVTNGFGLIPMDRFGYICFVATDSFNSCMAESTVCTWLVPIQCKVETRFWVEKVFGLPSRKWWCDLVELWFLPLPMLRNVHWCSPEQMQEKSQ